jgi:hypothetical protein
MFGAIDVSEGLSDATGLAARQWRDRSREEAGAGRGVSLTVTVEQSGFAIPNPLQSAN